jgi:Uma2 family endonuclease
MGKPMMISSPMSQPVELIYPSSDGEPLAESYAHLLAILATLEVLRQYLEGQAATVLANQFLYYSQGFPKLRVAPDVMVILGVTPGGRDNYKIWEEGQVPAVIFEMTSGSTKDSDQVFKYNLYEQLGVQEYWLFDPKGEWLNEQLRGYRLVDEHYQPIADGLSQVLNLRLTVEAQLIHFYRQDTGEKLLTPTEQAQALREQAQALRTETQARQVAEAQAEQAMQQVQALQAKLKELGIDWQG